MKDIRKEVFQIAKKVLASGERPLLELATGVGKTRIALDLATDFGAKNVLILVPTDAVGEAWVGEINKWGFKTAYQILNYASGHKIEGLLYQPDLIIADEVHHLGTDLRMEWAVKLKCPLIGLSATVDNEKMALLETLGFKREISVSLDEATEHDIVAPYEMSVITFLPDSKTENMIAGNKERKWYTTEAKSLTYMESRINQAKRSRNSKSIEFAYIARTRMIRTLPSRLRIAESLLKKLRAKYPASKMLVFAPDIAKCEALVPDCYYHSKSDDSGFTAFREGVKHTLGSVNALSEGINVHADMALIVAGFSKERHTVQRLGRLLRKTAEGKLGKAFLLVAKDTQDEVWAENALSGLSNVKYYKAEDLGL